MYYFKVFDGNKDSDTVVYNSLNPPIVARHIRIQPVEWHGQISMRMELYGCSGILKTDPAVISLARTVR